MVKLGTKIELLSKITFATPDGRTRAVASAFNNRTTYSPYESMNGSSVVVNGQTHIFTFGITIKIELRDENKKINKILKSEI